MKLEDALKLVDDNLPDGAWMACLCEMTDMDAGEVSAELVAIEQRKERKRLKHKRHRANRAARRAA